MIVLLVNTVQKIETKIRVESNKGYFHAVDFLTNRLCHVFIGVAGSQICALWTLFEGQENHWGLCRCRCHQLNFHLISRMWGNVYERLEGRWVTLQWIKIARRSSTTIMTCEYSSSMKNTHDHHVSILLIQICWQRPSHSMFDDFNLYTPYRLILQ